MNIPNDTGHPWRLKKFTEYQSKVPPIEPAMYLAWAKQERLSKDDCVTLAWFNSMSYCGPTAFFLFQQVSIKSTTAQLADFWTRNKAKLIFASARRYVKNMNWFCPLVEQFISNTKGKPFLWLQNLVVDKSPVDSYESLYRELMTWQYMGRFSVELFTDAMVQMSREELLGDLRFVAPGFEWRKGANVTSGLLNMFYKDEEADAFDKTGKLLLEEPWLDDKLAFLQRAIKYRYPAQDNSVSVITPKICSWRNLFKGTRYGGYHHDRAHEQLQHYQQAYPAVALWGRMYELRKRIFVPELLGEIGGWPGIRKDRKKLFLTEGLTGVEGIPETRLPGLSPTGPSKTVYKRS